MNNNFLKNIGREHIFIAICFSFLMLFFRTCAIDEETKIVDIKNQQDSISLKINEIQSTQLQILKRTDELEATYIQYFLYKDEMTKNNNEILALKERLKVLKELRKNDKR